MSVVSHEMHFIASVSSIPVINSVVNIGTNFYSNVKNYNRYVDTTLSKTENLIVFIIKAPTIQNLAKKLEKPLAALDTYAYDGLQTLEHRYPSIRMDTDEFKEEAYKQMIHLKDVGIKRVEQFVHIICRQRRQRMDKVLLILESMLSPRVEVYVDVLEKTVDNYLPPLEERDEDQNQVTTNKRMFHRLAVIPFKVKSRLAQRYHQMVFDVKWTSTENKN